MRLSIGFIYTEQKARATHSPKYIFIRWHKHPNIGCTKKKKFWWTLWQRLRTLMQLIYCIRQTNQLWPLIDKNTRSSRRKKWRRKSNYANTRNKHKKRRKCLIVSFLLLFKVLCNLNPRIMNWTLELFQALHFSRTPIDAYASDKRWLMTLHCHQHPDVAPTHVPIRTTPAETCNARHHPAAGRGTP